MEKYYTNSGVKTDLSFNTVQELMSILKEKNQILNEVHYLAYRNDIDEHTAWHYIDILHKEIEKVNIVLLKRKQKEVGISPQVI